MRWLLLLAIGVMVGCANPGVTKSGVVVYTKADCEIDLAFLQQAHAILREDAEPLELLAVSYAKQRVERGCRAFPELQVQMEAALAP